MSEADISQGEKKGKAAELSHGEEAPKKGNEKEADISQEQNDLNTMKLSHMPLLNPELKPGDISSFGLAGAFALSYWDAGPEWFEKYAAWKAHRWKERKDELNNRKKEAKEEARAQAMLDAEARMEFLLKKMENAAQHSEEPVKSDEGATKTPAPQKNKTGKKVSMEEAAKQGAEGEKKAKTAAEDVKKTQGKKAKTQEEKRKSKAARSNANARSGQKKKSTQKGRTSGNQQTAAAARRRQADGKSA